MVTELVRWLYLEDNCIGVCSVSIFFSRLYITLCAINYDNFSVALQVLMWRFILLSVRECHATIGGFLSLKVKVKCGIGSLALNKY